MDKQDMQIIDHLSELRNRIIITLIIFIITLITALVFVQDIYEFLIKDFNGKLAILGPSDILWIYIMTASIIALSLTIPIATYQIWRFIQPALSREEQRGTILFIPIIFILFIVGISFGYFVLFPLVLSFLTNLAGDQFETFFTAEKYFHFLFQLTVPFGFLFEIPAVTIFLTKLGIVTPQKLRKGRKLAYFLLVIVSVFITPPDFISDVLVIIPLFLLYEISITLSSIVYKKRVSTNILVTSS